MEQALVAFYEFWPFFFVNPALQQALVACYEFWTLQTHWKARRSQTKKTPQLTMKKAVIYIDLDNYPIKSDYNNALDAIETNHNFEITSKKVFGDLQQLQRLPQEVQYSHQLIVCQKVSSRKNSTDIALTIEVIRDLERKKAIDVFIIASSDSDFVPVVKAIRDEGKECWILPSCANPPPESLVNVCHGVFYDETALLSQPEPCLQLSNNTPQTNGSPQKIQLVEPRKDVTPSPKQDILVVNKVRQDKQKTLREVKSMISSIVRRLKNEGVPSFNLSYVHERLRDQHILYKLYGFETFKSLFDEWKREQSQFIFSVKTRSGELVFVDKIKKKDSDLEKRKKQSSIRLSPEKINSQAIPVPTRKSSEPKPLQESPSSSGSEEFLPYSEDEDLLEL